MNDQMRRRDQILRQECQRKTKENAFLLKEIDLLKRELQEARMGITATRKRSSSARENGML